MQLDLSSGHYTKGDVARLLASGDDSSHSQLRISSAGIAYLSKDVGSDNINGVALRLETWVAGNDYVGPAAAQDDAWVTTIFNALKKHWPNPSEPYVDLY